MLFNHVSSGIHFSGAAPYFSGKIDPAPLQKMARTPMDISRTHAVCCLLSGSFPLLASPLLHSSEYNLGLISIVLLAIFIIINSGEYFRGKLISAGKSLYGCSVIEQLTENAGCSSDQVYVSCLQRMML